MPSSSLKTSAQQERLDLKGKVLLVEDDRVLRMLMSEQLSQLGYDVIEAENGQVAYDMLSENAGLADVIILDREMPVMNGMEFIKAIKNEERLKNKIIIMSTGYGNPEQIGEGVAAGVFYYLVKPVNPTVLATVLTAASQEADHQNKLNDVTQKQETGLALLVEGDFTVTTIAEAQALSRLLAPCFAQPDRVIPGIEALIVNSIEHGHLGIGFDLKKDLLEQGLWQQEIEKREALPENANKKVQIHYQKTADKQILIIKDEGYGFNWKHYLQSDTSRATQMNGRGLLQARQNSFNEVTYNAAGNQVIAVIYR